MFFTEGFVAVPCFDVVVVVVLVVLVLVVLVFLLTPRETKIGVAGTEAAMEGRYPPTSMTGAPDPARHPAVS